MIKEIWNIAIVERSCRVNKWQFHMFLFQVRKLSFNVLWYLGRHTGLISSDSFQITTLTDVSLWKFSHCGYKKWYSHFYICQIKISEIWHQFEKNEKICQIALTYRKIKNKYQKAPLLVRPQRVARGVKRFKNRHFWEFSFSFFEVSSTVLFVKKWHPWNPWGCVNSWMNCFSVHTSTALLTVKSRVLTCLI